MGRKLREALQRSYPEGFSEETFENILGWFDEVEYYNNGGILHYVLRGMAKAA